MAAIDAHEHIHLTGPAADEAARRLEAFGERARFQGAVVLDDNRLRWVGRYCGPGQVSAQTVRLLGAG